MIVAPFCIWLLDSRETPSSALAAAEAWLSASERGRLATISRSPRREQFLLGRAMLRLAVAGHAGCDPAAIGVVEVPGHAPALALPSRVAPFFSLSHSGHWIACTVDSEGPLGLDVETISTKRDVVSLSEWRFHAEEHAWLLRQPDRTRAFYALWTGKEAMVKLLSQLGQLPTMSDVRFTAAGDSLEPPAPAASWHQPSSSPEVAVSLVTSTVSMPPPVRMLRASDLAERVLAMTRY